VAGAAGEKSTAPRIKKGKITMKAGKDMTREEKIAFLSDYKIPVAIESMTDNELSGAVNMVHLKMLVKK